MIAGVFITPSFAGLLLVQTRLSALARETDSAVDEGKAGGLIVELSWLRTAMLRFLITFAAAITAGLLALGALRIAVLAFGTPAAHVPPLRLLTYGGVLTALTALIFVPAYVAWQERVSELRDTLHPVPEDGRLPHDWMQARDDLDTLLRRPGQRRPRPRHGVRRPGAAPGQRGLRASFRQPLRRMATAMEIHTWADSTSH